MKKYDNYKDSGIEWIGEIPRHWELKKGSYFLKLYNGYPFNSKKFTPDSVKGIPIVRIRDILKNNSETYFSGKPVNEAFINNGDVLIGMDGDFNIGYWQGGKALLNQRICKVNPSEDYDLKYIFYILPSYLKVINDLTYYTTVKHLSNNDLHQSTFPFPLIEEQTTIANYLDKKTTEIDQLIADKEELLQLYAEEKTAVINQAVTKGIDPDVKMKDSGVEWLGEIPEHWKVKRFKYYFDLINDKEEEDLPKIGLENIESGTGRYVSTNSEFEGLGVRFKPKDILFGKLRPYLAKVWLSTFDGRAVGDFYVFRANKSVLPKFAKYRILDSSFIEITNSSTYGSKMPRVNWEFIANLPIAFQEIQEQQSIVNYIETESKRIDTKIENTQRLIELLKEYREALISEVVTGKVKVV